ncbi:TorF family putative porin [Vreelandella utahensis]|uniref:TorF family putative porin n=1 Tax=Vreelandella halophila TaxID=86177 RepID=UPI00098719F7|nr:TorF family putative porin [Halomonas utahensis]
MKTTRTRLASTLAAGLIGSAALMTTSTALAFDPSVDASLGISSMYLWRGTDLGDGDAQVAGSLDFDSGVGAYAGVWTSSGDSGAGQEYDLYAGYATDITEDVSVDAGVINYIYPDQSKVDDDGNYVSQTGFGDFSEAYLGISAYGFGVDYYNDITSADYQYVNASYGYGPFGIAVGRHIFDDENPSSAYGEDMTHLDLSFQFNDELSFTTSTMVDSDTDDAARQTTFIQVTYAKSFSL